MSDMAEVFKAMTKERKHRNAARKHLSTQLLRDVGIPFLERNGGLHLIIPFHNDHIDFWPSTGRFIFRSSKAKGVGVHRLLHKYKKLGGAYLKTDTKRVSKLANALLKEAE